MNENSSESKERSYKVAGAIVAGVLILVALIIFGLSKIEITKKPKSTPKESNTEVSQENNSSETSVSSLNNKNESTNVSVNSDDITLIKVRSEEKLDYSTPELETTGVISNKSCYLQGNQIVYLLDISIGAGASYLDVKYYCPYDTYMSVVKDDIVTVKYKQVSDSTFAVMSVHK